MSIIQQIPALRGIKLTGKSYSNNIWHINLKLIVNPNVTRNGLTSNKLQHEIKACDRLK